MNQGSITKLPNACSEMSDKALITRAQQGDKESYKVLYERYVGQVYALTKRLCGDQSHAEDATQETFIQVWHSLKGFSGESKFSTWLHRVTANVTVSHMRRQKNWLQRTFGLDNANEQQLVAPETASTNELDAYIQRLPERARMVFVLHAIEGYRHEEIAQMTQMAVGSSKAQYHRAKQLLKEWLSHDESNI